MAQEIAHHSVIAEMAQGYGMDPAAFEATLRNTVVPPSATRAEFLAFCIVAKEHNLNPITREIFAMQKQGGGLQPIVSVDGWANIINSHPQFDGLDFVDHVDVNGNVTAITCRIHRKDRSHPIEATEYLAECVRPTQPWKQWPRRMLRHKALIQCARYCFGFAGIIDPDEYDRRPVTPPPVQWQPPIRTAINGPTQAKAPPTPDPAPEIEIAAHEPVSPPDEPSPRFDEVDFDETTGEVGPRAIPYTASEDGSHWRDWAIDLLNHIEATQTLNEVEAWLAANKPAIDALEAAVPKMHARFNAAVGRRKVALAQEEPA